MLTYGNSIQRLVVFITTADFDFWGIPESYGTKGKTAPKSRAEISERVETIKQLALQGLTYFEIAARLNVKAQSIRQTVNDYNNRHRDSQIKVTSARGISSTRVVERDALLYEAFQRGNSYPELVAEFKICKALVSRIVKKLSAAKPSGNPPKAKTPDDDEWNF